MSWITIKLLGYRLISALGVVFPQRSTMNLIGATAEDDEVNKRTNIIFTGTGLLEVTGEPPIVVTENPDAQHLKVAISAATTSQAGSFSAADKTKLDGIPTPIPAAIASAQYVLKGTSVPAGFTGAIAAGGLTAQLVVENDGGSAIVPIRVNRKGATGSVLDVFELGRTLTSGVGTVGTGARAAGYLPDGNGDARLAGRERLELTAVSGASITAKRVVSVVNAGSEAEAVTLHANRTVQLHGYSTAGMVLNDSSGLLSSANPALLVNGVFSGVSNALNIQNLTTTLPFYRDGGYTAWFTRGSSTTDTALPAVRAGRIHTGFAPAVGLGSGYAFGGQDDEGNEPDIGWLTCEMTNVGELTFASRFAFWAATAATLTQVGSWATGSSGFRLHAYGTGILHSGATGIITSSLITDADIASNAGIVASKLIPLAPTAIKTSAYSAAFGELVECDPAGGAFTVTLPSPTAGDKGKLVGVKINGSSNNTVTVSTPSGTIDNTASRTVAIGWGELLLVCDGTNGYLVLVRPVGMVNTPTKTANYTTTVGECVICDPTGGGLTITLPLVPSVPTHREVDIIIKNIGTSANTITIDGNGAETVDGSATASITTGKGCIGLRAQIGTTNWMIVFQRT